MKILKNIKFQGIINIKKIKKNKNYYQNVKILNIILGIIGIIID